MSEPTSTAARKNRLVVGYQSWRSMVFLHWEVPVDELRRRIPPELAIDTYEGRAYVGVVAFSLDRARVRALPPLPFVAPALELNVRTYVRTPHGPPGIFFLALDATRWPYVVGARALVRNVSHWAHGAHVAENARQVYVFERRTPRAPASLDADVRVGETIGAATPGSLEHFLVERYVMYAPTPRSLWRMRVRHPAYVLQRGEVRALRETYTASLGLHVGDRPASVLTSPGVDAGLLAPERVGLEELLRHADDPASNMIREGSLHARRPAHWA